MGGESQRRKGLGGIVDGQSVLKLKGNVERGRQLFFNTPSLQCTNCHRIDRTGGELGPDLTHIGKTYPRHELLEALVDPSKKIDPKFATHMIVAKNAQPFTALAIDTTKHQLPLTASNH